MICRAALFRRVTRATHTRAASTSPGQASVEERAAIKAAVRDLCADFSGSYWRELDKTSTYPTEFINALQTAGYLSMLIPEEYGGSGLQLSDACAVLETIHASGCNAGAAHAQMYTMGTVLRHGSPEQKQMLLPGVASGDIRLQAFGVSEPNNGTDTMSLETSATLNGDHYLINGQKMWTSRAEHSDYMILLARTKPKSDDPKERRTALSVFLVDMREALKDGMEIHPVETMMNHSTTTIFFDNVKVPKENLLGEEGKGLDYILTSMNSERVLIASECIGDGRYFVAKASEYAKERRVFGRPIGQNQGVQFPIAKAYTAVESAALMVDKAAAMYDAGEPCGPEANMAKYLAAEASWQAADMCIQTHGGYGFAKEFDVERKFRETRLYQVAPISTNLILTFLSEKVLGLPRSY